MAGQRYTRELLEAAVRKAETWDEAVRLCGGEPTSGSRRYLRKKAAEAGIDTSHLREGGVRHTEETLRAAVEASTSIKDVVRHLGISNVGGNQTHISRRIAALGIDTSHFTQPKRRPKGSLGSVLSLRSPDDGRIPGRRLSRELLRLGVPEACALCGCSEWHGDPVRLEVDHINGSGGTTARRTSACSAPTAIR
uniref:HNH endonuclease n=1 Tax=Streptomyces polyasparticus TaxID=2767826 RepID=UPI003F684F67